MAKVSTRRKEKPISAGRHPRRGTPSRPLLGSGSTRGGRSTTSDGEQSPAVGLVLRLVLALALAAAVYYGGFRLYYSPLFTIETVVVQNTKYLDPQTIVEQSGLIGQNVFTADLRVARERLLAVPMIRDAELQRQLPRQVRIVIREREPWGFWEIAGKRYTIDEDGVVLNRGLPVEGAPVIVQSDTYRVLQPGERVDADALRLAQTLQQRLSEVGPGGRFQPVAFEFRSRDGLTAVLKSGLRVTFGDSHGLDYKLSALRALLTRVPDATSVDLRFGDRIVFQAPAAPVRP